VTEGIIFKREDLNPTGSLKDRGIAYQISDAFSSGKKNLLLSSSGNAAISAAAYCQLAKINLQIYVSPKINSEKLSKMRLFGPTVIFSNRPLSDSIKTAKESSFFNLRPSAEPAGIEGYKTIAFEIYQDFGRIEDLFLPVSSATALVGIAEGFRILGFMPRIHACQSTEVFAIAGKFDKDFVATPTSLAEALVARTTPRKEQAIEIIEKSDGFGWVIEDGRIRSASEWLMKNKLATSEEGALTLASIWKAKEKRFKLGRTVCLLSGRKYKNDG
jgi:threonine synthase